MAWDKAAKKAYYQKYYLARKDEYARRSAAWAAAHPDKAKEIGRRWAADNPDRVLAKAAKYRVANREKMRAATRVWRAVNRPKLNAIQARYRAAKLRATPPWLTLQHWAAIEAIYVEASRRQCADGIPRHVDHIYPLQGKTCSGLHVPWNLQILIAVDNIKKHNHIQENKL